MLSRRVLASVSKWEPTLSRSSSSAAAAASSSQTTRKRNPAAFKVPEKMKAWQLNSYKGLAGLELTSEAQVPVIEQGKDLLIQVKATSVNPLDVLMSQGYGFSLFELMRSKTIENFSTFNPFPLTLGRDFSGVVVDKGMDVGDYNVGDQVWGSLWPSSQGSHAEFVLASNLSISRKPENLSHVEAASIPYAALTGWSAIVTTGNLTSSSAPQKILILGASGGVGTFAVQLLKAWNHEVTGVAKSDAVQMVQGLGADRVLDYTLPDFGQELSKSGPFDLILDFSGGQNDSTYLRHLKKNCGSKYVSTSSPLLKTMDKKGILFGTFESAMELINKNLGSLRDQSATYRWAYYTPNPSALSDIAKLAQKGKIRPVVQKVYPLSDLKSAFQKLSDGGARGKLVVEF